MVVRFLISYQPVSTYATSLAASRARALDIVDFFTKSVLYRLQYALQIPCFYVVEVFRERMEWSEDPPLYIVLPEATGVWRHSTSRRQVVYHATLIVGSLSLLWDICSSNTSTNDTLRLSDREFD